jgi:hypothetical protein
MVEPHADEPQDVEPEEPTPEDEEPEEPVEIQPELAGVPFH